MKFPAADGPSTRFPLPAGVFGADATGGGASATGDAAAGLVDASERLGFSLVDGIGDWGRGTGGRAAEAEGSGRGATGDAVETGAGEVGGGGNGAELQPLNDTTRPSNKIPVHQQDATAMIHDLDK